MEKILLLASITCFLTSCSDKKEIEVIKNQNQQLKSEIEALKDSINSLLPASKFEFNVAEPLAVILSEYHEKENSIRLLVGHNAYNSEEPQLIRYWIDDSTRSDDKMIEYKGNSAIEFNHESLPEHSKRAMEVGEHSIYGMIRLKVDGQYQWGHWTCDYSIK